MDSVLVNSMGSFHLMANKVIMHDKETSLHYTEDFCYWMNKAYECFVILSHAISTCLWNPVTRNSPCWDNIFYQSVEKHDHCCSFSSFFSWIRDITLNPVTMMNYSSENVKTSCCIWTDIENNGQTCCYSLDWSCQPGDKLQFQICLFPGSDPNAAGLSIIFVLNQGHYMVSLSHPFNIMN